MIDGLSHEVSRNSASISLPIGEVCGSPSRSMRATACVKFANSSTEMPFMNFCHSVVYSVLYICTSAFWICSGLPSSVRSSLAEVLSTQSSLCSSLNAAVLIAS